MKGDGKSENLGKVKIKKDWRVKFEHLQIKY